MRVPLQNVPVLEYARLALLRIDHQVWEKTRFAFLAALHLRAAGKICPASSQESQRPGRFELHPRVGGIMLDL